MIVIHIEVELMLDLLEADSTSAVLRSDHLFLLIEGNSIVPETVLVGEVLRILFLPLGHSLSNILVVL